MSHLQSVCRRDGSATARAAPGHGTGRGERGRSLSIVGEKLTLLPHEPPHRYWRERARLTGGLGLVGAVSRDIGGAEPASASKRRGGLALLPHGHRGARLGLVGAVSRLRCGRRGLSPHRRRNDCPTGRNRPDRGVGAEHARPAGPHTRRGSVRSLAQQKRGARIHPGTLVATKPVSPRQVRGLAPF